MMFILNVMDQMASKDHVADNVDRIRLTAPKHSELLSQQVYERLKLHIAILPTQRLNRYFISESGFVAGV